ncbi:AAA family ATPase [Sorangium sp. So ce131]|uniref:AAA family ATPase n=1 Tax=Sorangium sp. So ce131 TaxID=3133282 RepID=UPI003F6015DE
MLTTISMTGFRTFEHVEFSNLGRINLLVGENGAGKTSFLEAVRLLGTRGHPAALLASAIERGEYDVYEDDAGSKERVALLHFAFLGRKVDQMATFAIDAEDTSGHRQRVSTQVFDAAPRDPEAPVFFDPSVPDPESPAGFETRGMFPEWAMRVYLGPDQKSKIEVPLAWSRGTAHRLGLTEPPPGALLRSAARLPVFLRSNSLDDAILARLWDDVAATPNKETVIRSLQRIEPSVRDIDLRSDRDLPFRSRVALRLSNGKESRAPIGSLGEGVTWLFALALGAAATPYNLLLVDDIDAGLHHSVMDDMWTMVIDAARERKLQVFATTHSIDCLTALRRACERDGLRGQDVRVVRLIRGGEVGITFTADELATAIEGEVEVRG